MKTIPEIFFQTAEKFSKKPALLAKESGVYFSYTFEQVAKKVKIFANVLLDLRIQKGERVAILSENRPEWVIADLGIMSINAIVVPLHTTLNPKAICNVLNHSEAKTVVVAGTDLLLKILFFQKELPFLEKIIYVEQLNNDLKKLSDKKILNWDDLVTQAEFKDFVPKSLNSEDVCTIIYTSGTTGNPKGVMLSHRNLLENVEAVKRAVPIKTRDLFLSFLPLSHVLERLAGYYVPLLTGASIAYAENIKKLSQNLKETKPTILISVPRIFEKFYDVIQDKISSSSVFKQNIFHWALKRKNSGFSHWLTDYLIFKKIRNQLGGRLRLTVSGGASLNKKIAKFFLKIGILILEGYGLTETSPVISVNQENDFKFGTVGKVLDNIKIEISPEKEILMQGPSLMKGYYKDLAETQKGIDKDNWFQTGDLGFIDQEGFLTVIGRKKEMLVTSGGKNVWPEKVEKEINHDPYISQSMIVGQGRKFISALIVPDWEEVRKFLKAKNLLVKGPEELVKSLEVLDLFRERIELINRNFSHFEDIVRFKLIVNEFSQEREELTPTLKLRRQFIEKHYQQAIEEMYF